MKVVFGFGFLVAFAVGVPLENHIVKMGEDTTLQPLIKARIDDLHEIERTERLNNGFEKMIKIVDIMSQLDHYVVDKTKLVLKKLASFADDQDIAYKKYNNVHHENDNTIQQL